MATMKDVAIKSGVSITTVSHVINETRFVSEDVVERVNAAIKELNYLPSVLARSLKNNQTKTIGMLIPNNSNPFFADLIRGVEDTCYSNNYSIILCNTDDDLTKQIKYLEVLIGKQVDGLIIVTTRSEKKMVDLLTRQSIPVSIVDREVIGLKADLIKVDNVLGGYLAAGHLIELGHMKIGCISGPPELKVSIERVAGFRKGLKESGLAIDPRWIIHGDFHSEGGYNAMKQMLSMEQRPTAIFACNDLMAFGSLCAAHEQRLTIPHDLSIMGFDDIRLASYSCPPLTTIMQPKHELGVKSARILLDRIENIQRPIQKILLEPQLVVRKSTKQPGS